MRRDTVEDGGRPSFAGAVIEAFDVPPGADEPFLAAWEAERGGVPAARLHRALRPDVAFRFVEITPVAARGGALYEVVGDDGTLLETQGGVVLIDLVAPPGERFAAGWDAARAGAAAQRGFLGARLYRDLGPAGFPFVGAMGWSSPLMLTRALERPEFRQAREATASARRSALYQVIRDATAR